MKDNFDDTAFPLSVNSRFINFCQTLILYGIKGLAGLMTLTILWSMVDVAIALYKNFINDPFFFINIDEMLKVFGSFLVVLIAIEIFLNIILYLKKNMGHLKMVLATALMAIARKIIILDYNHIETNHLFGMGVIIIALGITYWLISNSNSKYHIKETQ